jgi:hypothetical protein
LGGNLRELEGGWRGEGEGKQGTWLDLERGGVLLIDRDTKDILELFPVRDTKGLLLFRSEWFDVVSEVKLKFES